MFGCLTICHIFNDFFMTFLVVRTPLKRCASSRWSFLRLKSSKKDVRDVRKSQLAYEKNCLRPDWAGGPDLKADSHMLRGKYHGPGETFYDTGTIFNSKTENRFLTQFGQNWPPGPI